MIEIGIRDFLTEYAVVKEFNFLNVINVMLGIKMSFTSQVKEELLLLSLKDKFELSAIIRMLGSIDISSGHPILIIVTENAKIARHLYKVLLELYNIKSKIRYHQKRNLRKNRVYTLFVDQKVKDILSSLCLSYSFFGFSTGIDQAIFADHDASRSYLRGSFLSNGSIKDPEKGKYQLEILSLHMDHADDIANLMKHFLLDAKIINRKKGFVTYLQRAEDIMDFLIIIGAMNAKNLFEEIKIFRETRNDLNRATNAETANITRMVNASMKTINNIGKIMDTIGLENMPYELQEVAKLRIKHPDYSIQDLAISLKKPLTKSGLNHRLRRINKIASQLENL